MIVYKGTAVEAFDELAIKKTNSELLGSIHDMWCGHSCSRDISCSLFHYMRPETTPIVDTVTTPRSRYNKETAHLFTLMGGDGYKMGTEKKHVVNTWPLVEAVLGRVDTVLSGSGSGSCNKPGLLFCDYTDWSKKQDCSARQSVEGACRDTLQWAAAWAGAQFNKIPAAVLYVAFSTICDDICVPPLDLLSQRFRLYGKSARDLMQELTVLGWGSDATLCLLLLVRQYIFQYVEKVDHGRSVSVHDAMSRGVGIWDSTVYRMHTANTIGAMIAVAHMSGVASDPLSSVWIYDSAICDAISMDLCKSAMSIYQQDNHMPTAGNEEAEIERQRLVGYHSLYLDLIDDLVNSGAPETVVHFGRAGFLFVQMNHRYLERRLGSRRFAIHAHMIEQLRHTYGYAPPADAMLSGLFQLRRLVASSLATDTKPTLPDVLLDACLVRQQMRRTAYDATLRVVDDTGLANASANVEIVAPTEVTHIHGFAQRAQDSEELQVLLSTIEGAEVCDRISAVGADNVWALCVGCQVDCGGPDCEWLAFARYMMGRLW